MHQLITDDLDLLLATLPLSLTRTLQDHPRRSDLIEIVMDLGRPPEARFPEGEVILSPDPVTAEDIAYVTARVGNFGDDNRAGIERTLHRISAIRNRRGAIVGLTCRVGRAVSGTIPLIQDVVESGRSLLILGRPGVGKTTMLREVARVLADDLGKRVVIVDTSNEIAGDGDVPHPGIGRARRMQVAHSAQQHAVMIEAVENHMPQVIIIDEIGTELEAQAARTIAERGVQLVGTAHGNTLDNLLLNPTLSDLIGGIGSVTLGDEEAKRRGTQKTVLERKAPPTFDVVVEQQDRTRILVHADVAVAVDSLLRGEQPQAEMRTLDGTSMKRATVLFESKRPELAGFARGGPQRGGRHVSAVQAELPPVNPGGKVIPLPLPDTHDARLAATLTPEALVKPRRDDGMIHVFVSGIEHERVEEIARELVVPLRVVADEQDADVEFVHRKRFLRRSPDRDQPDIPMLVLPNRTRETVRLAISQIFGLSPEEIDDDRLDEDEIVAPELAVVGSGTPSAEGKREKKRSRLKMSPETAHALQEAEDAIHYVLHGNGNGIALSPQRADVRRMQHLLAERYNLVSRSYGKEPHRHVRIFSSVS